MQAFSTCIVFNAAAFMIESLYLAAGKAGVSLLFSVSRLLLLVPLVVAFSAAFGLNGIIYSMPAADLAFCAAIALPLYLHFVRSLKRDAVFAVPLKSSEASQSS